MKILSFKFEYLSFQTADFFDRLNEQHLINRLTKRIKALGYKVDIEKLPLAA
jgi:hypothetical protein